jgi:hypothetical protein
MNRSTPAFRTGRGTAGLCLCTYARADQASRQLDIMDQLFFIQHFFFKKPLGKPDRHPACASLSDGQLVVTSRDPAARRLEDDVDWGRLRGLPKKGGETI